MGIKVNRNLVMKNIHQIQTEICQIINDIGGRIRYIKPYNVVAQCWYVLSSRAPVINIEALLLGERFGVIIGRPPGYRFILRKSTFKIFHVSGLADFKQQFQAFKQEKLAK